MIIPKKLNKTVKALKRRNLEPFIKEYFEYSPKTGVIKYKKGYASGSARKEIGDIAGFLTDSGYVSISIKEIKILAHHIAWFLYHGVWAVRLDHKDRNRSNNKIKNLREAITGNQQNRSRSISNTSGHTGVSFHKASGRWRAFIYVGDKQKSLGYHDTKNKAIQAYTEGKKKYHKFNPKVVNQKVVYG